MSSHLLAILRSRLAAVEERLQQACRRAGRARGDVTLVAVTKQVSSEVAALLPELGVLHLGESRPQELWRKAAILPAACHWHLVGHLQRNKVERTLRINPLIHSVDSLSLLETLEKEATKSKISVSALLEVNASREPNKHGFAPELMEEVVGDLLKFEQVQVRGLMTMAAWDQDPEKCRPSFALVRQLAERFRGRVSRPHALEQLSMGMSNDFEVAVEEGATMVRIGTALFEGLPGE
jgi:pyridoxal phosphate enzyme (YggS family)